MPERSRSRAANANRGRPEPAPCFLGLVCLTAQRRELAVLLSRVGRESDGSGAAGPWRVPSAAWRPGSALDESVAALARRLLGVVPPWREQCGAQAVPAGRGTPPGLSLAHATVVPRGTAALAGGAWHPVGALPAALPAHDRAEIAGAVRHVIMRMDYVPIAFRLLPAEFTLSALQETYETLLARKLHKASFRRALLAAHLVEPTDEWRSDGRGRPAQFYRFAPKRRRVKRMVRFELLGG